MVTNSTSASFAVAALCIVGLSTAYSGGVRAGSLYKCVDSRGQSSYQEMPCPKTSKLAGRGYVQPVAASPNLGWAQQADELAAQQQVLEASYDDEKPRTVAPRVFAPSFQQVDTSSPSAQRERRTRNYDSPPAYHPPPQTLDITDQHGRHYTQQPGSSFARDNKTKQTCFVYGGFMKCK